jgi:hypothetical protein
VHLTIFFTGVRDWKTPNFITASAIVTSKYLRGPFKSYWNMKSWAEIAIPNINIFYLLAVRLNSGGLLLLRILVVELIAVLLMVSEIIEKKPIITIIIIPKVAIPPVTVLYWVSPLYLSIYVE